MRALYSPTLVVWILIALWSVPHAFAVVQSEFDSYTVGKALASVLLPTLLGYLVATILWFMSGRSRLTASIGFCVAFILLALVQIIGRLGSIERIQQQALTEPFSTSQENCTRLARAWPVLNELEQRVTKSQTEASTELKKLDAEINSPGFVNFDLMRSRESVAERKATLEKYLATWKTLADFVDSPTQTTLDAMKTARVPDEGIRRATLCLKKGMSDGLAKSPIKSAERYVALAQARQEETLAAIDAYAILERNWGNWTVEDGVPVLTESRAMDEYNEAISRTERATEKAAAIIAEVKPDETK